MSCLRKTTDPVQTSNLATKWCFRKMHSKNTHRWLWGILMIPSATDSEYWFKRSYVSHVTCQQLRHVSVIWNLNLKFWIHSVHTYPKVTDLNLSFRSLTRRQYYARSLIRFISLAGSAANSLFIPIASIHADDGNILLIPVYQPVVMSSRLWE